MDGSELLSQISSKDSDKGTIAAEIIRNPELLCEIFEGLNHKKPDVKHGCDKLLRIISDTAPSILYPNFVFFHNQLANENNFLKWSAVYIIANLTSVDVDNKFEPIFNEYFAPIPGPVMITAGNVINGAGKIALSKPYLTERITKEILKVEKGKYQTAECRNIVIGHAIKSFGKFFNQIEDKDSVLEFIKKQTKSPRIVTKKKAEEFLKKHQYESKNN
jgi:hypothetical protein